MIEETKNKGKVKIDKDNWEKEAVNVQSDPINVQELESKLKSGEPRSLRTHVIFFKVGTTKDEVISRTLPQIEQMAWSNGWMIDEEHKTPIEAVQDNLNKEKWFVMVRLRPRGTNSITRPTGVRYKQSGLLKYKA